jgi:hypothetical protein
VLVADLVPNALRAFPQCSLSARWGRRGDPKPPQSSIAPTPLHDHLRRRVWVDNKECPFAGLPSPSGRLEPSTPPPWTCSPALLFDDAGRPGASARRDARCCGRCCGTPGVSGRLDRTQEVAGSSPASSIASPSKASGSGVDAGDRGPTGSLSSDGILGTPCPSYSGPRARWLRKPRYELLRRRQGARSYALHR